MAECPWGASRTCLHGATIEQLAFQGRRSANLLLPTRVIQVPFLEAGTVLVTKQGRSLPADTSPVYRTQVAWRESIVPERNGWETNRQARAAYRINRPRWMRPWTIGGLGSCHPWTGIGKVSRRASVDSLAMSTSCGRIKPSGMKFRRNHGLSFSNSSEIKMGETQNDLIHQPIKTQ